MKELEKQQESRSNNQSQTIRPVHDITEIDGAVILRMETPGVAKDALEVDINGDTLTVLGRRHRYAKGLNYLIRERRDYDYRATYTLDERIDRDRVEAKMENGVLTVTLNLREEIKPRRIEVNVE